MQRMMGKPVHAGPATWAPAPDAVDGTVALQGDSGAAMRLKSTTHATSRRALRVEGASLTRRTVT
jgi:hypothetical protein